MPDHPYNLQADSINRDCLPTRQPLPVELLASKDQRRTSRTEPDTIDALVNELRRVAESKEAT